MEKVVILLPFTEKLLFHLDIILQTLTLFAWLSCKQGNIGQMENRVKAHSYWQEIL